MPNQKLKVPDDPGHGFGGGSHTGRRMAAVLRLPGRRSSSYLQQARGAGGSGPGLGSGGVGAAGWDCREAVASYSSTAVFRDIFQETKCPHTMNHP